MSIAPQSLAGAPWLTARAVQAIFAEIGRDGDEIRIVGGAVRNALLGVDVVDVDFATTATPDVVAARAEAAGFKVVPTGVEHGTLTLVVEGRGHEVTTLREDVETDGRRAVVRFGRDWVADARRRDFTVNALSVDQVGTIHDPLSGYDDVLAGRIRFIGDADQRIAEDRLRILRFFRFHAQYGRDELDHEGLSASIRARNGLRDLSAERIGQEMRRLAVAARAAETVSDMQDAGILPIVLGGVGYVAAIRGLQEFEKVFGLTPSVPLRLAAIGCRIEEDALRLGDRLRLSNSERDRMLAAAAAIDHFHRRPDAKAARRALYELGPETFRNGVALGFAWSGGDADAYWRDLFTLPDRWTAPSFPLSGRDVLGATSIRGPQVGTLLRAVEAWWIENDFAPGEAALRSRLQQMMAAAQ